MNTAIKNAKRRMASFKDGMDKPSEYDPGTMVYKLVQELKVYLDEKHGLRFVTAVFEICPAYVERSGETNFIDVFW